MSGGGSVPPVLLWVDPLSVARHAIYDLEAVDTAAWQATAPSEVTRLRSVHADQPIVLRVGDAADHPDHHTAALVSPICRDPSTTPTGAHGSESRLRPTSGSECCRSAPGRSPSSRPAVQLGDSESELVTDHVAVERGLSYLPLAVRRAPPERADVMLAPAVAVSGPRIWTVERVGEAIKRAVVARYRGGGGRPPPRPPFRSRPSSFPSRSGGDPGHSVEKPARQGAQGLYLSSNFGFLGDGVRC